MEFYGKSFLNLHAGFEGKDDDKLNVAQSLSLFCRLSLYFELLYKFLYLFLPEKADVKNPLAE